MSDIINALESLNTLPALLLVGLLCIVLGYVLKFIPKFPNDAIPLACVVAGGVINALLAEVPQAMINYRAWAVRNVVVGVIVGFFTWTFHKAVLSQFEGKIPFLGTLLKAADLNAGTQVKDPVPPPPDKPPGGFCRIRVFMWTFALSFTLVTGIIGCATSQSKTTYTTLAAIGNAVNAADYSYTLLVVNRQVATNSVPQVSAAFNTFQQLFGMAVLAAENNLTNPAPINVLNAGTNVLTLINSAKGLQ